jgi:hypothetical protein
MKKTFTLLATALIAKFAVAQSFTPGNIAVLVAAASANNTTGSIVELNTTAAAQTPVTSRVIYNDASAPLTTQLRFSGSATSTAYLSNSNDGSLLTFTGANSVATTGNVNTVALRGVGAYDAGGNYNIVARYTCGSGDQTRSATSLNNTAWYIADQGGIFTNDGTTALLSGNYRGAKSFGGTMYFSASSGTATVIQVSAYDAVSNTLTGLPGLTNNANLQDYYMISSGSNGTTYDVLYVLSSTANTSGTIAKYSLVTGSWVANGTVATTFGGFGLAAQKAGTGASLYVTTGAGALTANSVIKVTDAAGYNAPIDVTAGNNITLFTTAAGTIIKGVAFTPGTTTMPLNLVSFNAVAKGTSVQLQWTTANEVNVDRFEVERTTDLLAAYTKALTVQARNTTGNQYTVTDGLGKGTTYYRLKMIDKDGAVKYSQVVTVKNNNVTGIKILANPVVNGTAIITHEAAGTDAFVQVIAADGKAVLSRKIAEGTIQNNINVSHLHAGTYYVVLSNNGERTMAKLVKQ